MGVGGRERSNSILNFKKKWREELTLNDTMPKTDNMTNRRTDFTNLKVGNKCYKYFILDLHQQSHWFK